MEDTEGPVFGVVRRPEYTGENRCWPCTVVNLGLLAGSAAALAVAGSPAVAGAVALVGALVVWARGYLVPGTPRFAPRLVETVPGGRALFSKPDEVEPGSVGDGVPEQEGERLLRRLVDVGVLATDGGSVRLAPDFAEEWHAEMDGLASLSTADLADAVAGVSPQSTVRIVEAESGGNGDGPWIALSDDASTLEETWIDRPVAVAETAALRRLPDELDDVLARAAAAHLGMFLSECPDCGTALESGSTVACCGGYDGEGVPGETVVCPACESRLYTFEGE